MQFTSQIKKALPLLPLATLVGVVICSPSKTRGAADNKFAGNVPLSQGGGRVLQKDDGNSSVPFVNQSELTAVAKAGTIPDASSRTGKSSDKQQAEILNTGFTTGTSYISLVKTVSVKGRQCSIIDCTQANEAAWGQKNAQKLSALRSNATVMFDLVHQGMPASERDALAAVLVKEGYNVVFSRAALTAIPDFVDVIFMLQPLSGYGFLPEEVSGISDFVKRGGCVVLVGASKSKAAEQIASRFGVTRRTLGDTPVNASLGAEFSYYGNSVKAVIHAVAYEKAGASRVLQQENGNALGVSVQDETTGKGRLICLPLMDKHIEFLQSAFCDILKTVCKGGKERSKWHAGVLTQFEPDRLVMVGGDCYHFSAPMTYDVVAAMARFESLRGQVSQAMRVWRYPRTNDVYFTSSMLEGEGDWSKTYLPLSGAMDECAASGAAGLVFLHSSILPANFKEALAFYKAEEVVSPFFSLAKSPSRLSWKEMLELGSKSGAIDLRTYVKGDQRVGVGRAMWIIKQLESSFGKDFMAQVVAAHRSLGDSSADLSAFMYVVRMVAMDILGPDVTIGGRKLDLWIKEQGLPAAQKPQSTLWSEANLNKALSSARNSRDVFPRVRKTAGM